MKFKFTKGETALGDEYRFHGPGLSQYANGVHLLQVPCEWALRTLAEGDRAQHEAETILKLLHDAFEAGRQDAKREIRQVLGL